MKVKEVLELVFMFLVIGFFLGCFIGGCSVGSEMIHDMLDWMVEDGSLQKVGRAVQILTE